MDWRYAVLELYPGDLGRRRLETLFLPLFSSMVEASRSSSSLSISSWESQIWLEQVLFVLLLCAAMEVGTGRNSVLCEAADLVIQGIIKLAFSAVNVNLLALLRPLLLELQIKSLRYILSESSWSQNFAAYGWGARCREHHEILATVPLHLLVEGRPLGVPATTSGSCNSSWPPSHMGGSLSSSSAWYSHVLPPVHRWCYNHSSTPSGFVPGGGGIVPGSKTAKRTRLLFIFVVWGPICKISGLGCNFLFLLGLSVICCMLI